MKRIFLIFLIMILSVSTVQGLQFDVNIDALASSSEYGLSYSNNTTLQHINTTVINSGSVGCGYRLKGKFFYKNQTQIRYSSSYKMFPGAEEMISLYFIPENHTGEVETDLFTDFCGKTNKIKEFNYSSPESNVSEKDIFSKTLNVNYSASEVKFEREEGRLVPKKAPPYWKTGSAKIMNGTATIDYDAPIFKNGENITYAVLNSNNRIIGETKIHLKADKNIWNKLEKNSWKILLGLSVLFNLILLSLRLRKTSK